MGPRSSYCAFVPHAQASVGRTKRARHPLRAGFQSPSRWGRCCIAICSSAEYSRLACFSPLLDGDGVASIHDRADITSFQVSVPFSMGTVLHRSQTSNARWVNTRFQSPSRWGRCCIWPPRRTRSGPARVSVPFSMGTVLHLWKTSGVNWSEFLFQSPSRWGRCCIDSASLPNGPLCSFQSPSRWGRCCIRRKSFGPPGCFWFQSPSRWGRCCIQPFRAGVGRQNLGFSPLLDGDGVASRRIARVNGPIFVFQSPSRWGRCCISASFIAPSRLSRFQSPSRWGRCCIGDMGQGDHGICWGFSPLLDGDGVASPGSLTFAFLSTKFQSPSRWGRCCIAAQGQPTAISRTVSVPFSMGTVLHRRAGLVGSRRHGPFQSPSRWGRCCIRS